MMQAGSQEHGGVEPAFGASSDDELPKFLNQPRSRSRRSLGEALAGLTAGTRASPPRMAPRFAQPGPADLAPQAVEAGETPAFASAAPAPKAGPVRGPRVKSRGRSGSATGLDAWMSRAKRRRRSAAFRQFGAWSATILVVATIVATAALALTVFAAP